MKRYPYLSLLFYLSAFGSLWTMTGINTSLTIADKYYGVNQSVTHYWTEFFSNNIGYSLSRSEGFPWMLNSASTGISATLSESLSLSGNLSQSLPSNGYSSTSGSGTVSLSPINGDFSMSWSLSYSHTVNRQDYTNYAYQKPSVLSYGQSSVNMSLDLSFFYQTSFAIDFTGYWYDVLPTNYANATYMVYLNSLNSSAQGDEKIFTMQGVASGATHSSYGLSLSHQVFSFMRLSVNLNANRSWLGGNWTGSQSISCSFNLGDWSITPNVSRSNFLVPDLTGSENVKFNSSYTLSIYRSFK